jgi:hypothetical protein
MRGPPPLFTCAEHRRTVRARIRGIGLLVALSLLVGGAAVLIGAATLLDFGGPDVRRADVTELRSCDELEAYIEGRHERIRAFAASAPGAVIWPAVSLEQGLSPAELQSLADEYEMTISDIRYTAGQVTGSIPVHGAFTPADKEAELRSSGLLEPADEMKIEYFIAGIRAHDLAAFIDREPRVIMAFADDYLDRLENEIPPDVPSRAPEPITHEYSRLCGEGR